MRKPIHGSVSTQEHGTVMLIICDDGSMWKRWGNMAFERIDDIPQDQSELDKLKAEHALMGVTIDGQKLMIKSLNARITNRIDEIESHKSFANALKALFQLREKLELLKLGVRLRIYSWLSLVEMRKCLEMEVQRL